MTKEQESELMAAHDRAAWQMIICRELQTAANDANRVPRNAVDDAASAAVALESVLTRLRGWEHEAEAEMMAMRRQLGRPPGQSGMGA